MEGGRESLLVHVGFTSTASEPQNSDMKADCWSAESVTERGSLPMAAESTEVEDAASGKETSNIEADGGL